ncbi:MAG: Asp-tRNA(Asn)/Glu-tRNA(Gln) amidotransferase subunit GatB [Candidatus Micrarchaeia archaeon]
MEVKIGLETHVTLATKTKLFCSCKKGEVCPICMGFPGVKPRVNKKAVLLALQIAKILNCEIADELIFDRKSYFYPDLPKGFQITQFHKPIGKNGYFEFKFKGEKRKIGIRRVNIEEDPAKIFHKDIVTEKEILIDFSRSGNPLCEIVTEPELRSPEEAREYLISLQETLDYYEVIDTHEEAILRSDANVSIQNGERVEIKNITGFEEVEKALSYEIKRQSFLLSLGKKVERETRAFDGKVTFTLRKKEEEEDYGYIQEPDILPISLDKLKEEAFEKMKRPMEEEAERLAKDYRIELNISKIIVRKKLCEYFEEAAKSMEDYKLLSKFLVVDFLKCLNYSKKKANETIPPIEVAKLLKNTSLREAKELIKEMVKDNKSFEEIEKERKEKQKEKSIEEIFQEIQEDEKVKKAILQFKKGNKKAENFIIGEMLKKSFYKLTPNQIRKFLESL